MPVTPVNPCENIMKYVVGKRYGYMSDLKRFGDESIETMKSAGFLKTGYTMEAETYGATNLLKEYFIIAYGKAEYIKQRFLSVFRK